MAGPNGQTVFSALPHCPELAVAKDSVALHRCPGLRQIRHRIDFENPPPNGPTEQAVQVGVQPTRHGEGAPIGNGVDQLQHVTAGDHRDQPLAPCRHDVMLDRSPYLVSRSILRLVALEPLLSGRRKGIGRSRFDMGRTRPC